MPLELIVDAETGCGHVHAAVIVDGRKRVLVLHESEVRTAPSVEDLRAWALVELHFRSADRASLKAVLAQGIVVAAR